MSSYSISFFKLNLLIYTFFSLSLSFFSNKPNPAALNNNNKGGVVNGSSNGSSETAAVSLGGKSCESCNGMFLYLNIKNSLRV